MQLLSDLWCLERCVTNVRPLLTPDVAQQGVFVWFLKATASEGGGGWSREAGLQPHVPLWFVLHVWLLYACMCLQRLQVGLCTMSLSGCVCVRLYVHLDFCMHVCAWAECGKCCCLQANCYWQAHTDYWSQKVKCTLCSFLSPEAPFFCLSTFSPPIFIFYIFLSVILSCFFSLPDDFFLVLPPLSLHLWWF